MTQTKPVFDSVSLVASAQKPTVPPEARKAGIRAGIEDQRQLIAKEKRTLAHQQALASIISGSSSTKRRRIVSYLHSEKEPTFAPKYGCFFDPDHNSPSPLALRMAIHHSETVVN